MFHNYKIKQGLWLVYIMIKLFNIENKISNDRIMHQDKHFEWMY